MLYSPGKIVLWLDMLIPIKKVNTQVQSQYIGYLTDPSFRRGKIHF